MSYTIIDIGTSSVKLKVYDQLTNSNLSLFAPSQKAFVRLTNVWLCTADLNFEYSSKYSTVCPWFVYRVLVKIY